MNLDELLYRLPLIGGFVRRTYAYFKKNIAVANSSHVFGGLGIGFIIAGDELLPWGMAALTIGILGHVYAFIKGR